MGTRMGYHMPKPLIPLNQQPAVYYALSAFTSMPGLAQVIIPARDELKGELEQICKQIEWPQNVRVTIVQGGSERMDSVRAALGQLMDEVTFVAVHDAVRPLVEPGMVVKCMEMAFKTGAAMPALPCRDTLKQVHSETIVKTVDRSTLWNGQTPQCFRRDWLEEGYRKASNTGELATDDAGLVELEHPVTIVKGSSLNLKLTYPEDIPVAEMIIKHRKKVQ